MAMLAEAPIREAPEAIIKLAVSVSLIPPEALTPKSFPTALRINCICSAVAPPLEKPVDVFT